LILIGKNIVKNVHIDERFEVNIISKDLWAKIPMFFLGRILASWWQKNEGAIDTKKKNSEKWGWSCHIMRIFSLKLPYFKLQDLAKYIKNPKIWKFSSRPIAKFC
jgi:hypothetical protein